MAMWTHAFHRETDGKVAELDDIPRDFLCTYLLRWLGSIFGIYGMSTCEMRKSVLFIWLVVSFTDQRPFDPSGSSP